MRTSSCSRGFQRLEIVKAQLFCTMNMKKPAFGFPENAAHIYITWLPLAKGHHESADHYSLTYGIRANKTIRLQKEDKFKLPQVRLALVSYPVKPR